MLDLLEAVPFRRRVPVDKRTFLYNTAVGNELILIVRFKEWIIVTNTYLIIIIFVYMYVHPYRHMVLILISRYKHRWLRDQLLWVVRH